MSPQTNVYHAIKSLLYFSRPQTAVLTHNALTGWRGSVMPKLQFVAARSIPLLFFICMLLAPCRSYSGHWQKLYPGIEYQDLAGGILAPWAHIYAFRVDLKKNNG